MEEIARLRGGQANDEQDDAVLENDAGTAPAPPGGGAEAGPDGQPIGPDNIRDGTVRGTMGGPNQTQGEGQGG